MNQTPLTKRIPLVMWITVAITVFMVTGTLTFAAKRANDIAAENSATMIRGGYDAEMGRLAGLVYDYSIWDAAYDAADARDAEWLYDNMGSSVGYSGFNLLEIYWPSDGTSCPSSGILEPRAA